MPAPMTPKTGGARSPSVSMTVPATLGGNIVSDQGQRKAASAEPSPASTYGPTADGNSVPTTPKEFNGLCINGSDMGSAQTKTPIENIRVREGSIVPPSQTNVTDILTTRFDSPTSSPCTQSWRDTNGIRDVAPVEDTGTMMFEITTFKEGLEGGSNVGCGPLFKKHGFGMKKEGDHPEDPFVSGGGFSCKNLVRKSYSKEPAVEPSGGSSQALTSNSLTKFKPRVDRVNQGISPDNAQAILLPTACVFVANLCNSVSDQELQRLVERTFSRFGKVYVKIKRDARGMPFAFAQYEDVESSERAIIEGRGLMINGRQCRTERAKVNRSLYLHATNGSQINKEDAREILKGCGDLEKLWHPNDTDMQIHRLPLGIWVTFAFFQDARDAQAQFKDHPKYHLDQYDHHVPRWGPLFRVPPVTPGIKNSAILYIGNLPATANPEAIAGLFTHLGMMPTTQTDIFARSIEGIFLEIFAFVEFRAEHLAETALGGKYYLGDRLLTVVRKRPHRTEGIFGISIGSPQNRRQLGADRLGFVQHYSARALTFGVNPAITAAIFNDNKCASYSDHGIPGHPWALSQLIPHHCGPYGVPITNANSDNMNGQIYAGPATMPSAIGSYQYPIYGTGQYYPYVPAGYVSPPVSDANGASPASGTYPLGPTITQN